MSINATDRGGKSATKAPEPFLGMYLREMGATPRLDAEEERALAKELDDARECLARLAELAPGRLRALAPAGPVRDPDTGEVSLRHLDRFVEGLAGYDRTHDDPSAAALLRLARRAKARVDRAREGLITANLRLVVHLAKRYARSGLPFLDLIQEGNIGLMRAVEKFEHRRGHKFSTYAYWWIKQSIDRALLEKSRLIRLPFHLAEKRKKLFRSRAELRRELGRRPEPAEIARHAGIPPETALQILGVAEDALGFDDFSTEEGRDLVQCLADPNAVEPAAVVETDEIRRSVAASLQLLDERELEVIRLRFGIGHDTTHTLREIGALVDLSRERVRQIVVTALGKLQSAEGLRELRRGAEVS
jgi:RNA polymerase primary sigma factor